MNKFISFVVGLLFYNAVMAQGSTFVFTNTGTTVQMDTALNFTGRIWGKFLNSTIPIKVNIYYTNLGPASNLAITIPNGRRDFANAPLDSIWYPSCLANSLDNVELNPGEADMDIYVNSSTNWYLDTLGNPSAGQYDFVTVMLHEIGHGLAFLSLAKLDVSDFGSFGLVSSADIAPLTSSFPFPDLQGHPSTMAVFMENNAGQSLIDTTIFPNNSVALGNEFNSTSVYFDGPISNLENGGSRVRLYAPTTYASGSSMQHLNESTFPSSNPNSLMTPFINSQEVHHHPGDLTIAMMEDMGWNVNYIAGVSELAEISFTAFPNPAIDRLIIYPQTNKGLFSFYDMQGRILMQKEFASSAAFTIDVVDFARGNYIMEIVSDEFRNASKLILE
jgi:hypothetical protein